MTDGHRRNVRLLLEYDGTDFNGSQIQPDVRTVQGELENCLTDLLGHRTRTIAAGRTDAGVHALGQVVNFRTSSNLETGAIRNALNARLPDDILIRESADVDTDFNARWHAHSRRYLYDIEYRVRAVGRGLAWVVRQPLDLGAIRHASDLLPGHRDFTSFCIAAAEREHCLCKVTECSWTETEGGIRLEIEASRFVRGMVRSIVGTLVEVGRGVRSPTEMESILNACDRNAAGPTAPPHGLFLKCVRYDPTTGAP